MKRIKKNSANEPTDSVRMTSDMRSDSALGSRALACHNIFTDLMTSGLGMTSYVTFVFDIF